MNKNVFALALAAVMAVTAVPQKSHAFGIVNIIADGRLDYVGHPQSYDDLLATTLCIALLPLCILKDGAQAQDVMTVSNLEANGYSSTDAAAILEGHSQVAAQALAQGKSADMNAIVASVSASNSTYASFVKSF